MMLFCFWLVLGRLKKNVNCKIVCALLFFVFFFAMLWNILAEISIFFLKLLQKKMVPTEKPAAFLCAFIFC